MRFNKNSLKAILFLTVSVFWAACAEAPNTQNLPLTSSPVSAQKTESTSKSRLPVSSAHGDQTDHQSIGDLNWRLVDGDQKTLANYRGRIVILDFWATYCPPCEEEIPHLVELSNKYPKELQVVGLHVGGAEDKPNIADFVSKYKMSYDLGYPSQGLMNFYLAGDDRIPQTLVFDRRGNLLRKFVGFTPEIKSEMDEMVQTAVAIQ